MRQPSTEPIVKDTVLLSGWLFADFLLALAVIFLTNIRGWKESAPTPTVTSTSISALIYANSVTPHPSAILVMSTDESTIIEAQLTVTPSSSPTPQPTVLVGLDRERKEVTMKLASYLPSAGSIITDCVDMNATQQEAIVELNDALRKTLMPNGTLTATVGMVISFGRDPNDDVGMDYARRVNQALLHCIDQDLRPAFNTDPPPPTESFWDGVQDGNPPNGGAILWIYTLTR